MYSAVRTNNYHDYLEAEMDDRESLYFDTISLAESEVAQRRSLSQSRNTIYHSAVDLADDDDDADADVRNDAAATTAATAAAAATKTATPTMNHRRLDRIKPIAEGKLKNGMQLNNRHSTGFEHAAADTTDDAIDGTYLRASNRHHHDQTRRRFQDGLRSVDFVLAFDHKRADLKKREIFEANLLREGLQMERDNTQQIHFIKLHAPIDVLCRYAEILKIKLPMKPLPGQELIDEQQNNESFKFPTSFINSITRRLFSYLQFNAVVFPERAERIHYEFSRNYRQLYDWNHPNFFDAGTRNLIINFILERQHFVEGEETPDNLGIEKLIEDGVYVAAYTLHDDNDRDSLLHEWANIKRWKNFQPLDYIKDYFGPKVALYFAWLGFYTQMLIPISIIGVLCFAYGLLTRHTDAISREICNDNVTTIMCPQCDRNCDYWQLNEACNASKLNYLIDNNMTVLFAFIMSIWAVLYLEFWKRYSAGLIHRWGLTDFSQHVEHPRPQYLAKIRNSKRVYTSKRDIQQTANYPCHILEPEVPFWSNKFLPNLTSYSIVVLFICISLIAISAMIVYRMAQKATHSILGDEDSMTYKVMVLPLTAGIIDLIIISLLDYIYTGLAVTLTNYEYCRTQTEYNESLTVKNYVFQFVNYYSSLFYIGFIKSKFVGYPAKYNRLLGFRQEECNPGGCLMELCLQLIIIMIGKQAINAIIEMLLPYMQRSLRKFGARYGMRQRGSEEQIISCNQWTEDFHLLPADNNALYPEYFEMVLQYGFITLFGLAFPLAPLLALINNVIEVRLDAIKMLKLFRRPVAQRARSIGVWQHIMTIVTKIAVVSSAIIIAFSTNFIPKLVYKSITNDEKLDDYLNFTLARFNTEHFEIKPILTNSAYANITECRYTEFRTHAYPYKRPIVYWQILVARLAFIVIYQNLIGALQAILAWAVPDVPRKLRKRIKRETFLLREHIIEYEKQRVAEQVFVANRFQQAEQQQSSSLGDDDDESSKLNSIIKRKRTKLTKTNTEIIDDDDDAAITSV